MQVLDWGRKMNRHSFQILRIAAIFLATGLCFSAGAAVSQETLRIGYFDIPPHVVKSENSVPKGAAISYFNKFIAPHLGISITWDKQVTPPTRLMDQLRNGDKDAMIFLGKTQERTKYLHYPQPYLVVPETLAFKSGHAIGRVTKVGNLHGLTIGFLVGGRIPSALQDKEIKYDLIAGKRLFERNVEKLLIDRVDAVYAPLSTALVKIVNDMGVSDQIKLVPIEFLEPVRIFTVFSKKTVTEDLVEKYNKALEAAAKKQKYIAYIEAYHKRAGAN